MQFKISPKYHIQFDLDTHTFTARDGSTVPSVTQVLREHGYVSAFYKGTEARDNGTEIHELTQLFDQDTSVIPQGSNEFVTKSVQMYAQTVLKSKIERVRAEEIVYSPLYNYAGILDGVWKFQGELWIGDIKTGSTIPSWCKLQLAAYDIADGGGILRPPMKRFCIHVRPDSCKIKTYDNKEDYNEWKGLFK